MDGVRVLDAFGKVLYTIRSVGEMVSIGRDRKCGIALGVDAQGVSRIHGSLKWSSQSELTLQDNSTYGTVVNGKLVKGACQTLQDGAHIFVGDVELVIVFPQHQHRTSSSSGSEPTAIDQDLSLKRKGNTNDIIGRRSKKSKLEGRGNMHCSNQRQISSFLVKKSCTVNITDNDCITLAEETPQSQMLEFVENNPGQMVSFVSDSASSSYGSTKLSDRKPGNRGTSDLHTSSGFARRKKQCIFDVSMQPPSYHSTLVFAEDTQEKVDSPRIKHRSGLETAQTNRDITSVQETCEQSMQSSHCSSKLSSILDFRKEVSSPTSTAFGKQISALHNETSTLNATDNIHVPNRKASRNVTSKKTCIFDGYPSCASMKKSEGNFSSEKNVAEMMVEPNVTSILKLVCSGKRYDDAEDDGNTVEGNGVDIARVVAKLSNLVHYADIERQPVRAVDVSQSQNTVKNNSFNFKRFRKASQGRFNASLSSANAPCIIGGKDDLVDFRQLSHVS